MNSNDTSLLYSGAVLVCGPAAGAEYLTLGVLPCLAVSSALMARRGTNKRKSTDHEDAIADLFEGVRSASSGAAVGDQGDVRDRDTLFECKATGEPGKPAKSTLVRRMDKIADEAWSESRDPALALRFFMPESVLSDIDGWVDLVVRRAGDDAERSALLRDPEEPICDFDGMRKRNGASPWR